MSNMLWSVGRVAGTLLTVLASQPFTLLTFCVATKTPTPHATENKYTLCTPFTFKYTFHPLSTISIPHLAPLFSRDISAELASGFDYSHILLVLITWKTRDVNKSLGRALWEQYILCKSRTGKKYIMSKWFVPG